MLQIKSASSYSIAGSREVGDVFFKPLSKSTFILKNFSLCEFSSYVM